MVALVRSRPLDFGAALPEAAREAIRGLLATDPRATRRVYSALARKVWSLLVERRFDAEIRDWHALLHGVKVHIRSSDAVAAERLTALADLLRESISLAETSPAREVATRPRARRILELLQKNDSFVPRRVLMEMLGLKSSHLSNIVTQLVVHGLINRRENGKEAEFRITPLGRQLIGGDAKRDPHEPCALTVTRYVDDVVIEQLRSVPVQAKAVAAYKTYKGPHHGGGGIFPVVKSSFAESGVIDIAEMIIRRGAHGVEAGVPTFIDLVSRHERAIPSL